MLNVFALGGVLARHSHWVNRRIISSTRKSGGWEGKVRVPILRGFQFSCFLSTFHYSVGNREPFPRSSELIGPRGSTGRSRPELTPGMGFSLNSQVQGVSMRLEKVSGLPFHFDSLCSANGFEFDVAPTCLLCFCCLCFWNQI